jgi:hypothetical protein
MARPLDDLLGFGLARPLRRVGQDFVALAPPHHQVGRVQPVPAQEGAELPRTAGVGLGQHLPLELGRVHPAPRGRRHLGVRRWSRGR